MNIRFIAILCVLMILGLFLTAPSTRAETTDPNCVITFGPWQAAAPAPHDHLEGAAAVVNNKLYIFSGFGTPPALLDPTDRVDVWDPVTDTWETATTPRKPAPFKLSHMQAATDGRFVWFAGGFIGKHPGPPTTNVWRYDTVNDTWQAGPPLPQPRASGAFVRIGRQLHYIGGLSTDRNTDYPDHFTLDLDKPTKWKTAAPLPAARNHFQAVVIDGLLYTAGGQFYHDNETIMEDLAIANAYNVYTDTWSNRAPMPMARSHAEAGTIVLYDRLFIIGGRNNTIGVFNSNLVAEYNPQTNTWSYNQPLPVPILAPVAGVVQDFRGNPGTYVVVTNGARAYGASQLETWVSQITTDCVTVANPIQPPPTPPNPTPDATATADEASALSAAPNIGVFDPAISKLGILLPGQLGVTGERLEWIVTVSNNGTASGTNIIVTDTLRPELAIERVEAPDGIIAIAGQTVTVTYPILAPGQRRQFSIFTTTLDGADVDNSACVRADGRGELCTSGLLVRQLPRTGETPPWRATALALPLALALGLALWLRAGIVRPSRPNQN